LEKIGSLYKKHQEFDSSIERLSRLTNYGWLWTLVQSFYKRSKLFILIVLPIITLVVAFFLTPSFDGLVANAYSLFAFTLGIGLLMLLIDGIWIVVYRQHVALLDKTSKTLPSNCPFCGRDFQVEKTNHKLLFGFPGARFEISCSFCGTQLVSEYPFQYWVFTKVDTKLNSTFAWLYQGEKLSREDLNLVLNRQHTENAKVKLRASGNYDLIHIWFDKPTARTITKLRTGPLEKIVSGDMTALSELSPDVLYTIPEVNTSFFQQPGELVLRKRENVILCVAPVRLAAQQADQGNDEFDTKDTGFFFITNQRVGFRGTTHRTNLTIDTIDDLGHQANKIVIRSHHRKNPDYYLDLDGELVYCVIKGLLSTNEVS
jgi:hypothetical protein